MGVAESEKQPQYKASVDWQKDIRNPGIVLNRSHVWSVFFLHLVNPPNLLSSALVIHITLLSGRFILGLMTSLHPFRLEDFGESRGDGSHLGLTIDWVKFRKQMSGNRTRKNCEQAMAQMHQNEHRSEGDPPSKRTFPLALTLCTTEATRTASDTSLL